MAIEIVSFPNLNMDMFHSYVVRLPEGNRIDGSIMTLRTPPAMKNEELPGFLLMVLAWNGLKDQKTGVEGSFLRDMFLDLHITINIPSGNLTEL